MKKFLRAFHNIEHREQLRSVCGTKKRKLVSMWDCVNSSYPNKFIMNSSSSRQNDLRRKGLSFAKIGKNCLLRKWKSKTRLAHESIGQKSVSTVDQNLLHFREADCIALYHQLQPHTSAKLKNPENGYKNEFPPPKLIFEALLSSLVPENYSHLETPELK